MFGSRVLLAAGCAVFGIVSSCTTEVDWVVPSELGPPKSEAIPDVEVQAGLAYADTDPRSLRDFRSVLAPFGAWLDDEAFGTVWVPDTNVVGASFIPYVTRGHWTFDDEYAWVSDWEWGWLPFHYGRWIWIDGRGWAWIAGRVYSGAWVVWRSSTGWIGWAAKPPTWVWSGGVATSIVSVNEADFVFCSTIDLFSEQLTKRIVAGSPGLLIARRSDRYLASGGPSPTELGISAGNVQHASAHTLELAKRWSIPSTQYPPTRHEVHVTPLRQTPHANAPSTYRLMYRSSP